MKSDIERVGLSDDIISSLRVHAKLGGVNFFFGKAVNGDCFFDAVAQGIESTGRIIAGDQEQVGYKKIRVLCSKYVKEQQKKSKISWLKTAIESDARWGGNDYNTYCMILQYTQAEIEKLLKEGTLGHKYAIWGKPHIEGRIICEQFGIKLHVVEFQDARDLEEVEGNIITLHQLVNAGGSETVSESAIDYSDSDIVHIVVYKGHFMPLLPTFKKGEKMDQSADTSSHLLTSEMTSSLSRSLVDNASSLTSSSSTSYAPLHTTASTDGSFHTSSSSSALSTSAITEYAKELSQEYTEEERIQLLKIKYFELYNQKLSDAMLIRIFSQGNKFLEEGFGKYYFKTEGDGNCFFHAAFGKKSGDRYYEKDAGNMREEWHRFLSQFQKQDEKFIPMPIKLRSYVDSMFEMFFENQATAPQAFWSPSVKILYHKTQKELKQSTQKTQNLLKSILQEMRLIGTARGKLIFKHFLLKVIKSQDVIRSQLVTKYHWPAEPTLADISDGLLTQDYGYLQTVLQSNGINPENVLRADLQAFAYLYDPRITLEIYNNQYDPKHIMRKFLDSPEVYKAYLNVIKKQDYFIAMDEIPVLASLSHTTITVWYREQNGQFQSIKYTPDAEIVEWLTRNHYNYHPKIAHRWNNIDSSRNAHIHHTGFDEDGESAGLHYSRANVEAIVKDREMLAIKTKSVPKQDKKQETNRSGYLEQGVIEEELEESNLLLDGELAPAEAIKPISDEYSYPSCEYYWRYAGTSYFAMPDAQYWDVYHRSEKTRFVGIVGKKGVKYESKFHTTKKELNKEDQNSYYAHVGSYKNPLSYPAYARKVKADKPQRRFKIPAGIMREQFLEYRNAMGLLIVEAFESHFNKEKLPKFSNGRPIVFMENNFPCVLVAMPWVENDPMSVRFPQREAQKYWSKSKNPKYFQKMLMAYYVAIAIYHAEEAGIPIEIVMRSSFGHLLCSTAATGKTFRINVGIIPAQYAKVLGKSLYVLYKVFYQFDDRSSKKFPQEIFAKSLEEYNKERECQLKWKGTYWQVLRLQGSAGKTCVLRELLRSQASVELLANYVLDDLQKNKGKVGEEPIHKLFDTFELSAEKTISFGENAKKYLLKNYSVKRIWQKIAPINDDAFWKIVSNIFEGLGNSSVRQAYLSSKNILNLYANLEKLHKNVKVNIEKLDDSSDSDAEVISDFNTKLFARKITVSTGMYAISLAYQLAQEYLASAGKKNFSIATDYMYYETRKNLRISKTHPKLKRLENSKSENFILFFDLNYCNAENLIQPKQNACELLQYEIDRYKPQIVVIDYTSASYAKMREAFDLIFHPELYDFDVDFVEGSGGMACGMCGIETWGEKYGLVIFVNSGGLKYESGGSDRNPFGTLGIICNKEEDLESIYRPLTDKIKASESYLPVAAYNLRRAYKKLGYVSSLKHFLANWYYHKSLEQEKNGKFREALKQLLKACQLAFPKAYEFYLRPIEKWLLDQDVEKLQIAIEEPVTIEPSAFSAEPLSKSKDLMVDWGDDDSMLSFEMYRPWESQGGFSESCRRLDSVSQAWVNTIRPCLSSIDETCIVLITQIREESSRKNYIQFLILCLRQMGKLNTFIVDGVNVLEHTVFKAITAPNKKQKKFYLSIINLLMENGASCDQEYLKSWFVCNFLVKEVIQSGSFPAPVFFNDSVRPAEQKRTLPAARNLFGLFGSSPSRAVLKKPTSSVPPFSSSLKEEQQSLKTVQDQTSLEKNMGKSSAKRKNTTEHVLPRSKAAKTAKDSPDAGSSRTIPQFFKPVPPVKDASRSRAKIKDITKDHRDKSKLPGVGKFS